MSTKEEIHLRIESNLGLVHACCHRLSGRGIEYEELYSAGCLGLCKAAKGFKNELGHCFSTYAVPVILGEIRRLFRDGGSVKVSRSVKELSLKIARITPRLEKELGREPTLSELAGALKVPESAVVEAACAARPVLSLTRGEETGGEEWNLPVEGHEEELLCRHALHQALSTLEEEEKTLITLRYFKGLTQTKTAGQLGLTQVQVSRKERQILKKLRGYLL